MATKRFVSKDNLGRVWMRLFGKVLNSKEEIEANTSENMIAGADAVKEVYSSLNGMKFGTDGDGNCGYYGADGSLIPFSKTPVITQQSGISQNASQLQIRVGDGYTLYENLFYLITNISLVGYNGKAVSFNATYDGENLIITCSSGGQVGSFRAVAFMLN